MNLVPDHLGRTVPTAVAAAFALVLGAMPAPAQVPLGGLTVAVSADGKRLVAAGDTRSLIVLDPEKLTVLQRIWVGTTILRLTFDNAGKTLLATDTDGVAHLYDTQTWKPRASIPKRVGAVMAPATGLIAGAEGSHAAGAIFINDAASGAERAKIVLEKGDRVSGLGFDPQGRRLAVLIGPIESKEEPRVQSSQIPKELRGLERDEFQQKNDGQVSILRIYDAATGKMISELKTFFTMNNASSLIAFNGDTVLATSYNNLGARIEKDGTIKLFRNDNGFNYGIGASPGQEIMMAGGLRSFTITNLQTMNAFKGEIDRLPGWPEYFKGFTATAGAKAIYGATTAFRVIKLSPDGKVLAASPAI